jgi:S1-C subfamily serine protease
MIQSIYPNSPADKAGMHESTQRVRVGFGREIRVGGDVILSFQGKTINTIQDLQNEIARYKIGERVTVTVLRNNKKVDVPVTLEEAPRQ